MTFPAPGCPGHPPKIQQGISKSTHTPPKNILMLPGIKCISGRFHTIACLTAERNPTNTGVAKASNTFHDRRCLL